MVTTKQRRQVVTHRLAAYPLSARHACRLARLSRSRWHHEPHARSIPGRATGLKALAGLRPRWSYSRLRMLLRRDGRRVNHRLVLRLYREEGLAIHRRRGKKRVAVPRAPLPAPRGPNKRWSMEVVSDALADGRPFRGFTLVDDFTREAPAIEVSHSLRALCVMQILDRHAAERRLPRITVCDNGLEFAGKALDL